MTAPLSAERVEDLREQIRTGVVVIWSPDMSGVADIINIVERYSSIRAENERLRADLKNAVMRFEARCDALDNRAEKAEADAEFHRSCLDVEITRRKEAEGEKASEPAVKGLPNLAYLYPGVPEKYLNPPAESSESSGGTRQKDDILGGKEVDVQKSIHLSKSVEEAMEALDLIGEELKQLYKYRKLARLGFAEKHSADGQSALAILKSALSKGVEWERRYAELVEDISRRTDQARTMEVKP